MDRLRTRNVMNAFEYLRKDIGRALIQVHFSAIGRDYTYGVKSRDKAQHLAVPHSDQLPEDLEGMIDDLTGGVLGRILDPPDLRGTVIHLRELPTDWEGRVNRAILESFVLHIASACEWFVDEVREGESPSNLIAQHPRRAAQLNELRATRNCLLHNGGVVDDRYLQRAGESKRAQKGAILPLDWEYAYNGALVVLQFGAEASKTS